MLYLERGPDMTKTQKQLWIGLVILAIISPLGVILPEKFKAGDAWGEWSADTLKEALGYVPTGLKKASELWKAPIPDYNFGGESSAMSIQIISYIISGFLGILLAGCLIYLISRVLIKHEKE